MCENAIRMLTPSSNSNALNLFLIDAIGPFFRGYDIKKINWSKIPFEHLQTEGKKRKQQFALIREEMQEFAQRVRTVGYNAVTLDDVVHLADHPAYETQVRAKIAVFQEEFRILFQTLMDEGISVFVTMDIFSSTPALREHLNNDRERTEQFIVALLDQFLSDFPEVSGVIIRIGESDGLDVKGDFQSELYLKTARDLNRLLHQLLPVFEKHQRLLILRTWTVGAYQLGDLIWHRDRLARALEDIESEQFVLSMKHGESDFFRYLPINKSFFRNNIRKIVELQSKREYEGCGEFPAFIGYDHEHFAHELQNAENLIGISVWCQTGGWLPFRRRAYIGKGSVWTEINTQVTLRIFRYGESLEQAIDSINTAKNSASMHEFLRLSEEVIRELYYHEEFAQQKLFFRRVRVPTLIGVYWNTIFINHSTRRLLRHFVSDPEECLRTGEIALHKIERMEKLAKELDLPVEDIVYMRRTLGIMALARQYYYCPFDDSIVEKLKKAKKRYKKNYPKGTRYRYAVRLNFKPFRMKRRFISWSLAVLLRHKRGYRLIDQLFTIYLLSFLYRGIRRAKARWIPKFARKSAMGVDTIFK